MVQLYKQETFLQVIHVSYGSNSKEGSCLSRRCGSIVAENDLPLQQPCAALIFPCLLFSILKNHDK